MIHGVFRFAARTLQSFRVSHAIIVRAGFLASGTAAFKEKNVIMADPIPSPSPVSARALVDHRRMLTGIKLDAFFAADHDRFEGLSFRWNDWLIDLSKERWTPETITLLADYARGCELDGWIRALFAGEKLNLSERRPALHTALRQTDDASLFVDGKNIIPEIRRVQASMKELAEAIRAGRRMGATGQPIRAVVNIGIGGSDASDRSSCAMRSPASVSIASKVAPSRSHSFPTSIRNI